MLSFLQKRPPRWVGVTRGGRSISLREPQQDRSRATRARLLEAAIASLAELGYAASTVAVVAERAGVSRGAAQHHFPTREALFTAALEHVAQVRAEELRDEIAELPRGAPSTVRIVELIFGLYSGTMFRAALALWVAAANEPQLREQVVPLEARIGREVHRVVVDLARRGRVGRGRPRDRSGDAGSRARAGPGEPADGRFAAA